VQAFDTLVLALRGTLKRTCQALDRVGPFGLVDGLTSPEVDADGAELRGARGLRSSGKDIGAPCDFESYKARGDDRRLQLCVEQSTSDSTLPEVDVPFCAVADGFLDEDVADLQPAAGLEHARHLSQSGQLVGE
jgi:hypothetical protein